MMLPKFSIHSVQTQLFSTAQNQLHVSAIEILYSHLDALYTTKMEIFTDLAHILLYKKLIKFF